MVLTPTHLRSSVWKYFAFYTRDGKRTKNRFHVLLCSGAFHLKTVMADQFNEAPAERVHVMDLLTTKLSVCRCMLLILHRLFTKTRMQLNTFILGSALTSSISPPWGLKFVPSSGASERMLSMFTGFSCLFLLGQALSFVYVRGPYLCTL